MHDLVLYILKITQVIGTKKGHFYFAEEKKSMM